MFWLMSWLFTTNASSGLVLLMQGHAFLALSAMIIASLCALTLWPTLENAALALERQKQSETN